MHPQLLQTGEFMKVIFRANTGYVDLVGKSEE